MKKLFLSALLLSGVTLSVLAANNNSTATSVDAKKDIISCSQVPQQRDTTMRKKNYSDTSMHKSKMKMKTNGKPGSSKMNSIKKGSGKMKSDSSSMIQDSATGGSMNK